MGSIRLERFYCMCRIRRRAVLHDGRVKSSHYAHPGSTLDKCASFKELANLLSY